MDPYLLIFIALIVYLILIGLLKSIGVWRKEVDKNWINRCPKCKESLKRINRKKIDRIIEYLTFNIFGFKKYKCKKCSWKGLRWDKEKKLRKH